MLKFKENILRRSRNISKDIVSIYKLIKYGADNARVLYRSKKEIIENITNFWVCEVNGEIVACCSLEVYSKKLAEIRSLVVRPEFQGKGLGTTLINKCKEEAKTQGVYEILAVTHKDSLFQKNGFEKCLNGQWPMFMKLR